MLERLERALERVVEGSVAGVFRLRVQPADIGRQLERAMLDGRMTSVGAVLAPNQYEIRLHPEDAAFFTGWEDALSHEMEAWLTDLAYERGLATVGPIQVHLMSDATVARRSVHATSQFADVGTAAHGQKEPRRHTLKLVPINDVASSIVLTTPATVGRSENSDFVLPHAEVSRNHARLEPDINGRGWSVLDLDSTNGTWVNGVRIDRAAIVNGDIVCFGSMRFRVQLDDRRDD